MGTITRGGEGCTKYDFAIGKRALRMPNVCSEATHLNVLGTGGLAAEKL